MVGRGSYLEDVIIWPGAHIPPYSVFQETRLAELDGQLIQFPYESLNIQMEGSRVSHEKRQ